MSPNLACWSCYRHAWIPETWSQYQHLDQDRSLKQKLGLSFSVLFSTNYSVPIPNWSFSLSSADQTAFWPPRPMPTFSELLNQVWGLEGCPLKGQPVFTNFNKKWAKALPRRQSDGWLHKSQLCKAWWWRLLKTHVLDAWCWLSQIRTTLQLMW